MPEIFLSYRRQDNDHALSLYLWLIKKYGRDSVFWDRKDIDPGLDFADVIAKGLDSSAAFLALMGKGWLEVADGQGRRKIDSPDDWVRRETSAALQRGILVLPILGSGAAMPAANDLPGELARLSGLQALSMTDMRFHSLLAESLAQAGIHQQGAPGAAQPAARVAERAGNLLRRQAARLQVRAKELIRANDFDRAFEELNEGTELMMALLDLVPGETALDLQLGYMYAALGQHFDYGGNSSLGDRYMDLAVGIFRRVQAEVELDKGASGELASAIKGLGEVYYKRGDLDAAIRHYRQALEIEPGYSYAWHDLFGALHAQARQGRINLDAMRLALKMTKETSLTQAGRHPGLGENYLADMDGWMRECEERAKHYPHLEARAEERYSAEIAERPADPRAYFDRARARAAKGNTTGAIEDYTSAIARGDERPEVHMERALLRTSAEDYRAAEEDFTAALDRGATAADAYLYRGRCRLHLDDARGAEPDFAAAIEGGRAAAHFYRAAARLRLQDLEGAEADLSKAIELGESVADACFIRGTLRAQRNDPAGAAADFAAAIEMGKDGADVYTQLGDARMAAGDDQGAESAFTTAIERGAGDSQAYVRRGLARAKLGDTTGAAGDLQEAIARGADEPFLLYMLGKMRVLSEEAEAAEDSLDTAIARGYEEEAAYYWRGLARLARQNHAGAEADFTAAIGRGRDDGDAYYQRANARMMQGHLHAAAADLTSAIEKGHEPRLSYFARAIVHYHSGLVDATYDDCSQAISCGAEVAELYRIRAHAAARLGRLEQAEADCIKANELEPGNAFGLACWGELHMARGEFGKAADAYRAATEVDDNGRRRFAWGLALLLDGRLEEAHAVYAEGVRNPDPQELEIARVELDYWTAQRPEAGEAAKAIRPMLGGVVF